MEPCNKWQLERSLGINSRWDFFAVAQLLWANCALEDKSCQFLVRHISCEIRICDWFLWKNSMHVNPDAFSTPVGSWTFPSSFQLLKTVLNEYGTPIYKANQHYMVTEYVSTDLDGRLSSSIHMKISSDTRWFLSFAIYGRRWRLFKLQCNTRIVEKPQSY